MAGKSLTARSVKVLLARAGVDWRGLIISEQRTTSRDAWNGGPWETYTEVRIAGPKELRRDAEDALYLARLSCAGYPEYSLWSR